MSASDAKFLISFTGYKAECFTVTKFSGEDEISRPYRFDIKFKLSESNPAPWPPGGKPVLTAAALLGKPCHFKIMGNRKNEVAAAYHGVIMAFDVEHGFDSRSNPVAPAYSLRLVPWIELLSLNTNNRVFQKLKAVDIIQKVIEEVVKEAAKDASLKEYCKFRLECGNKGRRKADIVYNEIDFCVQYQETDLNFISRLMEQNGIWYYFEERGKPDEEGFREECMVITDSFDCFPSETIRTPFVKDGTIQADSDKPKVLETVKNMHAKNRNGSENADAADNEIDGENAENPQGQYEYPCGVGESIHYLSSKSAIIPQSVHLRAYNYRTPEVFQDGNCTAAGIDGARGSVYEYGGAYKDTKEADRGATLYLQRLQAANMRTNGKSNCKAFRAGRLMAVTPKEIGTFLLVSVKHQGGGNDTHNYNNEFSCVNAKTKIYAPPLRAVPPRAGGLITAKVDALGNEHPSLDGTGLYKVKLPFDLSETGEYAATKYIRLSLPSGGKSGGETYGLHLPSKQGAEMVLAYVDGNPDKPIGLGFVPNGDTQSTVNCNVGKDLNVIRTWGGNELVMDDTPGIEKVILASSDIPAKQQTDAKDDTPPDAWKKRLDKRLESAKNFFNENTDAMNSELIFDNAQKLAALRALKHKLVMVCNNDNNVIIIATGNNHKIKIDDKTGIITVNTAKGSTLEMNDQKNTIILCDAGRANSVLIDGEKKILSLQSSGNINVNAGGDITIKGKNVKIASGGTGGTPPATSSDTAAGNSQTAAADSKQPPEDKQSNNAAENTQPAEESKKSGASEQPPEDKQEQAAATTAPATARTPDSADSSDTFHASLVKFTLDNDKKYLRKSPTDEGMTTLKKEPKIGQTGFDCSGWVAYCINTVYTKVYGGELSKDYRKFYNEVILFTTAVGSATNAIIKYAEKYEKESGRYRCRKMENGTAVKLNPKKGDLALWIGHVEIVVEVDGEKFRTSGSSGKEKNPKRDNKPDQVPSQKPLESMKQWLFDDSWDKYLKEWGSSAPKGEFLGFWTIDFFAIRNNEGK